MNLLSNHLFRVQTAAAFTRMSLPELLVALGRDEVEHYPGLQPHQDDAFHVFLCYLAAAVLARRGDSDPVQDADYWLSGLKELAKPYSEDAWSLIVEDTTRPGFMQPPLPTADAKRLKAVQPAEQAPDAMDLLPTAKNHDVKWARMMQPQSDEWIYALISLQTMSGYMGFGNYGISRMNGGLGNRVIVEIMRSIRPGQRWQDAVTRLLIHRESVLAQPYGFDPQGLCLIWLEPWDGQKALSLDALDPFYIEISRRIRLRSNDAGIYAEVVPTKAARIAAKDLKGVVGDAWSPVDLRENDIKSLTLSKHGVTADLLRRLIFEDNMRLTGMQRPASGWTGGLHLKVSVLVRGQGTTDGFQDKLLLIPGEVSKRVFGPRSVAEPLHELSKAALESAGIMRRSVLRSAVFSFLQGGPEKIEYDDDSSQAWWDHSSRLFEALWTADYFPWLWSQPENFDFDKAHRQWVELLKRHAIGVLAQVQSSMPGREGRHFRSRVMSDRVFWGSLKRNLPILEEEKNERKEA